MSWELSKSFRFTRIGINNYIFNLLFLDIKRYLIRYWLVCADYRWKECFNRRTRIKTRVININTDIIFSNW